MNVFHQRIVPISIFLILLQAELPAPAVALSAPRPSFDWRTSATSSSPHHCHDLCTSLFSTHYKLVQRPHRKGRHILYLAPQQLGGYGQIRQRVHEIRKFCVQYSSPDFCCRICRQVNSNQSTLMTPMTKRGL